MAQAIGSKPQRTSSMHSRALVVFCLLALAPLLLAVFAFTYSQVPPSPPILISAALVLACYVAGYILLRQAARPLVDLARKMQLARSGNIPAIELDAKAPEEMSEVAANFNNLLSELARTRRNFHEVTKRLQVYEKNLDGYKKKLQQEAQLRTSLGRYVGHNVIEQLVRAGAEMPQNERRVMTILFSDIRSFTTISEHMSPEEVIAMLNEYFDAMTDVIFKHRGVLDKFVGDELMAIFGLIGKAEDAPMQAVLAAKAMRKRARELMRERNERGLQTFEMGIGINTGEVVVGNVGAKNRMDYTVIGDTVNVAARLEQMTKGQDIIVGEEVYKACKRHVSMREKGQLHVKNRAEPVTCYEVID